MKLFRKKEEKKCCCGSCSTEDMKIAGKANATNGIKVLGSGCAKCVQLEKNVEAALKELNMILPIDHVTDFAQIASYGIMSTPALVLNGKVVSYGKVLSVEEVKTILNQN